MICRILPLGAVLAACTTPDTAGVPDCLAHADCESTGACLAGACVGVNIDAASYDAVVDVFPPGDDLPQDFLITVTQAQNLVLESPLASVGTLSASLPMAMEGTMFATRASEFSTRSFRTDLDVTGSQIMGSLLPGTYDFVFKPDAITLPPQHYEVVVLDDVPATFAYPDNVASRSGTVLFALSPRSPVEDAWVYARFLDPSGIEQCSTVALTNSEGEFELFIDAAFNVVDLVVGPSPVNTNLPVRTFSSIDITAVPEAVLDLADPESVAATVVDSSGMPVEDATVRFDATLGGGTFSTTVTTTSEGTLPTSLQLRPGSYDIIVFPRTNDSVAAWTTTLDVPSDSSPTWELPNKISATGHIYSHEGHPVANARITWTLLGPSNLRKFSVTTDEAGAYVVEIDAAWRNEVAQYIVGIEPVPLDGLPRGRDEITSEANDFTQDFTLPEPMVVFGQISSLSQPQLENVAITIIDPSVSGPEAILGVAQTNPLGEYALIVPARE